MGLFLVNFTFLHCSSASRQSQDLGKVPKSRGAWIWGRTGGPGTESRGRDSEQQVRKLRVISLVAKWPSLKPKTRDDFSFCNLLQSWNRALTANNRTKNKGDEPCEETGKNYTGPGKLSPKSAFHIVSHSTGVYGGRQTQDTSCLSNTMCNVNSCRKLGISSWFFYLWKGKFCSISPFFSAVS